MFKFTTLYYRVDDEDKLEAFFSKTHLPLAEQLPALVKSEVSRIKGKPGGESRFHMAYSLYFATEESYQLSMLSDVGVKLVQALLPWEEARLITWYYADVFEEIVKDARPKLTAADLLPPGFTKGSEESAHSSSADDAAGM
ncbi:MAG: EthD family reductase [Candidatus Promineifilaceae bacterium]